MDTPPCCLEPQGFFRDEAGVVSELNSRQPQKHGTAGIQGIHGSKTNSTYGEVRMKDAATTVMERCDLLANISEEPGLIVRPYGSQAMREANEIVSGWMRMAGMTTRRDEKIGRAHV